MPFPATLPPSVQRALPRDLVADKVRGACLIKSGLESRLGQVVVLDYQGRLLAFHREFGSEPFVQLKLRREDPLEVGRERGRAVLFIHSQDGQVHRLPLTHVDKHNLDRTFAGPAGETGIPPGAPASPGGSDTAIDPAMLTVPAELLAIDPGLLALPAELIALPALEVPDLASARPAVTPPTAAPPATTSPTGSRPPQQKATFAELEQPLLSLLRRGERGAALRLLRNETGAPRAEAELILAELLTRHAPPAPPPLPKAPPEIVRPEEPAAVQIPDTSGTSTSLHSPQEERLLTLLRKGKTDEAIDLYGRVENVSANDAAAAIAALAERHDIPIKKNSVGCLWWIVFGGVIWICIELLR